MFSTLNYFYRTQLTHYVCSFALVVSVFFIIPFELYYTAQSEWLWDKSLAYFFAELGVRVEFAILVILYVLSRWRMQYAKTFGLLLFYMGIYILLADVFSPLQTNLMDGTELVGTEPWSYSLFEIILFIAIFSYAIKTKLEGLVLAANVSLLISVISIYYFIMIWASPAGLDDLEGRGPVISTAIEDQQNRGNIYHIVLDGMQSDAAGFAIDDLNLQDEFSGFTHYKNNLSNYLSTMASYTSYMTSQFYEGGSFENWYKSDHARKGLFKTLKENNYSVTVEGYKQYWNTSYVDNFSLLSSYYDSVAGENIWQMPTFSKIWFARLMPNFFTNEAFGIVDLVSENYSSQDQNETSYPHTYDEGVEPFSSVHMMRNLIATEKNRPEFNQYIYAHAIIPHPPYVHNESCEYDSELRQINPADGYYLHVKCAFSLVAAFINELKRLDRYDGATIIVHGDHGEGAQGFYRKEDGSITSTADFDQTSNLTTVAQRIDNYSELPPGIERRPVDVILARASSLLMLKPAGAEGELKISDIVTQLIDVYPTLVNLLDLKTEDSMRGRDITGLQEIESDNVMLHWFNTNSSEPDVYQFSLSNLSELTEANFSFKGIINSVNDIVETEKVVYNIGSEDEGGLSFRGFGEKAGNSRWAIGKSGQIRFRNFRFSKPTDIRIDFTVLPYRVNENKIMTISSSLASEEILLKPGYANYSVVMTFPEGDAPILNLAYADAASPESLGTGNDTRELSVNWYEISLAPIAE